MTSAFSWQNSNSLCPASFHNPRPNLPVTLKKEFIGPELHLRPVHAGIQWTLNSVLSACGNDNGRIRPPSGQGNFEELWE